MTNNIDGYKKEIYHIKTKLREVVDKYNSLVIRFKGVLADNQKLTKELNESKNKIREMKQGNDKLYKYNGIIMEQNKELMGRVRNNERKYKKQREENKLMEIVIKQLKYTYGFSEDLIESIKETNYSSVEYKNVDKLREEIYEGYIPMQKDEYPNNKIKDSSNNINNLEW